VWPTFSPDGHQVAFEWNGANGENADIYHNDRFVRRSTAYDRSGERWRAELVTPWAAHRLHPILSRIAGGQIRLMSPLGGSDLKLSNVAVTPPLAWSADGRYLATARVESPTGLYLIPVNGGEPRC
jgi:hypothetical protein